MKIYLCCSNGMDPYTTEIWRAYKTKVSAEQWRLKMKETDDEWNGCNFNKEIKKKTDAIKQKLGIIDEDGNYNDCYGGSPEWKEVKLFE